MNVERKTVGTVKILYIVTRAEQKVLSCDAIQKDTALEVTGEEVIS